MYRIGGIELLVLVVPLLIALVVIAIIAGVAYSRRRRRSQAVWHGESTALDILKERYARGEVTRDEYLEMRRVVEE